MSIQVKGHGLALGDRITVVAPSVTCGEEAASIVATQIQDCSEVTVRIVASVNAGGIKWHLDGTPLSGRNYSIDNETYEHAACVETGTYQFVAEEVGSAGWSGGTWEVVEHHGPVTVPDMAAVQDVTTTITIGITKTNDSSHLRPVCLNRPLPPPPHAWSGLVHKGLSLSDRFILWLTFLACVLVCSCGSPFPPSHFPLFGWA